MQLHLQGLFSKVGETLNFYSLLHKKHFFWSCKAPETPKVRMEDIPGVPMENKETENSH